MTDSTRPTGDLTYTGAKPAVTGFVGPSWAGRPCPTSEERCPTIEQWALWLNVPLTDEPGWYKTRLRCTIYPLDRRDPKEPPQTPQQIRYALLQATEEVLEEHGPEGATTIRIAAKAGLSIGTLYRCFRNKDILVAAAMDRRKRAAAARPPAPAPKPPSARTLEDEITDIVHPLVAAFSEHLPSMKTMSKGEREVLFRAELKRMADASQALLTRHKVPGPAQAAHILTLSCNKVVKDAVSNAPESFTDGRLEKALCRMCMGFVKSEQK